MKSFETLLMKLMQQDTNKKIKKHHSRGEIVLIVMILAFLKLQGHETIDIVFLLVVQTLDIQL